MLHGATVCLNSDRFPAAQADWGRQCSATMVELLKGSEQNLVPDLTALPVCFKR